MNNFFGGAFIGFIISTLFNFLEITMLMKILIDMRKMLRQFKSEGKKDRWLT